MKRFLVVGLGQLGYELARALHEKGAEVIAVDKNMDLIDEIRDTVTSAICLDSTDEEALKSLKVQDVDAAIIAIAEDIEALLEQPAMASR